MLEKQLKHSFCLKAKFGYRGKGKGKAVPLLARSDPESSRKLRFPDYMTTAQDGGKVISPTHRLGYRGRHVKSKANFSMIVHKVP